MIKDDTQNPADDPEAELRKRLAAQYSPDPTADPVDTGTPSLKVSAPDPAPFVPGPQITPPGPQTITPQGRGGDEPPPTTTPPPPTPPPSSSPPPPPTPPPAPGPTPSPSPGPQTGPGGGVVTTPSDPQGALQKWLSGGMTPEQAIQLFNQQYGRTTGNEAQYYPPGTHGPTDRGTIGLPGGYFAKNADGSWGWNVRGPEGPPPPGGTAGPSGQLNQQQALDYLRTRYGLTLSPAQITAAYQKWGGNASTLTTTGILDQVAQDFRGQGGGPGNQGTDTGGNPTGGNLGGDARTRLIGGTGTGTNGPTAGPTALWGPEFMAQVRAQLMQRLQSASGPVDENDPTIRASMTAAQDAASRQTEKERSQLAEHLYASGGLNTDAITQGIQQSGERNAVGLGSLRANLMQREVEGRRSELQNLLQLALQSHDSEMTNMIRLQLAALDAQLRREGLGVNLAEFMAQLNHNTGTQLTGA